MTDTDHMKEAREKSRVQHARENLDRSYKEASGDNDDVTFAEVIAIRLSLSWIIAHLEQQEREKAGFVKEGFLHKSSTQGNLLESMTVQQYVDDIFAARASWRLRGKGEGDHGIDCPRKKICRVGK